MDMEIEFFEEVKRWALRLFLVTLFFSILIWLSIFGYAVIYYLYIPAVAHIRPVHLYYPLQECMEKHSRRVDRLSCSFPSGNVSLVQKGQYELLARSQAYAIEVSLEMPESEVNRNIGMFMVQVDMLSQHGKVTKSSARPALLHYKSPLFEVIYTLFYVPGLLSGTAEEKQNLVVPLFEQFEEDPYHPTHFVHVKILCSNIQIYSAHLRIHAQFSGLRYSMYYWPVFSATIGVFMNFCLISVSILVLWFKWTKTLEHLEIPESGSERFQLLKEFIKRRRRREPVLRSSDVSSTIPKSEEDDQNEENESQHSVGDRSSEGNCNPANPEAAGDVVCSDDEEMWSQCEEYQSQAEEEGELLAMVRRRRR